MSKYIVKEQIELDGAPQEVGAEVELTDEQAVEFAGKVEKTAEEGNQIAADADAGAGTGEGEGDTDAGEKSA